MKYYLVLVTKEKENNFDTLWNQQQIIFFFFFSVHCPFGLNLILFPSIQQSFEKEWLKYFDICSKDGNSKKLKFLFNKYNILMLFYCISFFLQKMKMRARKISPYIKQIDLDVNRTYRNNIMFRDRYGVKYV